MTGWIAVGFIPTYAVLEVGTRKVAKRMSARPFLNLDSKCERKTGMKIIGL